MKLRSVLDSCTERDIVRFRIPLTQLMQGFFMSVTELSVATHKRLADQSRWPTTEADALCYKFLLQYLAESEVLFHYSKAAASGPIDPEQMWDDANAQKIALHLKLREMFPQFTYVHMFSFGVDPESNSPCALFVNADGISTKENSQAMHDKPDLARQEAVNDGFHKLFSYHMHIEDESSIVFEWEPSDEPLQIHEDPNTTATKH